MEPITLRIREETKESLEEAADEHGISVSAHVRDLIQKGREYDDLRERLESREQRIDDLEDQLARRSQIEEQVDELALELREERESHDPPWPVRWVSWWRGRE